MVESKSDSSITLYGTDLSGHVHRVILLLSMLELPYRFVQAPAEMRRSASFLALNPLGQVPVLEDDGEAFADSGAILVYLAKRYASGSLWLPENAVAAARVQRWLAIAAGELRFGPAAARVMAIWGTSGDRVQAGETADRLFRFMEAHLADRSYLAAAHPTIADLAMYAYTAHAPEGGVSLEPYPAIRAWLSRVESLPRFKPMPRSAPPAQAQVTS
jgi:glutathione S-transferase